MKTLFKILMLTVLVICLAEKVNAQFNWLPNSSPPLPNHDLLQVRTGYFTVMGGTGVLPSTTLLGIGVNTETPHYMLDIYGGDANISSSNNLKGYRIGGQMVLYTDGDPTSIYVGLQTVPSFTSSYQFNTCTGYEAGSQINLNTGIFNSVYGGWTGYNISSGSYNTLMGGWTGYNISNGSYNTLIGAYAGYFTSGGTYPAGSFNTMTGYQCGYYNSTGYANSYYGKRVAYQNNGMYNCMYGGHSGDANLQTDSNSFYGTYSNYYGTTGNDNVYIGMNSALRSGDNALGYASSNYNVYIGGLVTQHNASGNYNIAIGYEADAYKGTASSPTTITDAVAIGAGAVVNNNNAIILGNNDQWTGIGLSYSAGRGYPNNSLEICSRTQTGSIITNSSGLRFTNLTSSSPTITNPGTGVLGLDASGDVIYVPGTGGGGGIGTCVSPTILTSANGAINLDNAANLYFLGNSGGASVNNIAIGISCSTTPPAKLTIQQSSGSTNTIGEYVTNTDPGTGVIGNPVPVIGLKSILPLPSSNFYYRVGGWFEADGPLVVRTGTAPTLGYAIFVPQKYAGGLSPFQSGGTVDIGFQFAIDNPTYLLKVNGLAQINGHVVGSDSILKKDVTPFKYGIKAIRKLTTYSYKYNGIGGFDTNTTYIGLIAENLARNVPSGVVPTFITKDTVTHDTETVKGVYEEAVLYTAVNAIKEVDSATTSYHKADSIVQAKQQYTIDSLTAVLTSIQSCLSSLCSTSGDEHAASPHSSGNGNSGDTLTQNITLSASASAPLLYQNIPNPFSTDTKINYYIPQGTVGAAIVFYDSYGNELKTVQLGQTGNGTLNITPDNLSNGIYSYSLIVNGNVIDTKRMVLQK